MEYPPELRSMHRALADITEKAKSTSPFDSQRPVLDRMIVLLQDEIALRAWRRDAAEVPFQASA